MNILIVLTSHSDLGHTGQKTGFWIEEFAAPYYTLLDAGMTITLASPKGGQPPIDPKSAEPTNATDSTKRYDADKALQALLAKTKPLADIAAADFDAVFYPGGHGPLWDLTNDTHSIKLIESFLKNKKPVAAVCHAPAVLIHVHNEDESLFVTGKKLTGFSNTEEDAAQLTRIVPFLLEDVLKINGAIYTKTTDWACHVVVDGLLVTGQNPASSKEVAVQLLKLLNHPTE